MDLGEFFRTLRRQWILTLVLLLLTLFAVYQANKKFSGPYQAESVIVLLPSQKAAEPNGRNPYLSFDSSINVAGDIVLRQVMDPHMVANLAAKGYSSSYEIVDDPNTAAPMLDVTVTGGDKAQVESTLVAVTRTFQSRLDSLQQSLKPINRVTSMVIFKDPVAKLELSKKARVLVVFLVIGLVLTCAIPLMVDAEITRRRGRRGSRGPAQGTRGGAKGWLPAGRPGRPAPPRPRISPPSGYSRTGPKPGRLQSSSRLSRCRRPPAPAATRSRTRRSGPTRTGQRHLPCRKRPPAPRRRPGTAVLPGTSRRGRPGRACPCGGEAGPAAASRGHAAAGPDVSGSLAAFPALTRRQAAGPRSAIGRSCPPDRR